jgi:hypothetical protein
LTAWRPYDEPYVAPRTPPPVNPLLSRYDRQKARHWIATALVSIGLNAVAGWSASFAGVMVLFCLVFFCVGWLRRHSWGQ